MDRVTFSGFVWSVVRLLIGVSLTGCFVSLPVRHRGKPQNPGQRLFKTQSGSTTAETARSGPVIQGCASVG